MTRSKANADPARAHRSSRERLKLLNRIRRIRGQVGAVEELLNSDVECQRALHTLSACRGAISALMTEILEDHIRYHVMVQNSNRRSPEHEAAEELVDMLKSYL